MAKQGINKSIRVKLEKYNAIKYAAVPRKWIEWLERPFYKQIFQELKSLKEDKAPRPDGFLMCFYLEFLDILG